MSLFSVKRSSRRNIRKKVIELEEEEEGEGGGGEEKEGDSAPPTLEKPSVAANKVSTDTELHYVAQGQSDGGWTFSLAHFHTPLHPLAHLLTHTPFV